MSESVKSVEGDTTNSPSLSSVSTTTKGNSSSIDTASVRSSDKVKSDTVKPSVTKEESNLSSSATSPSVTGSSSASPVVSAVGAATVIPAAPLDPEVERKRRFIATEINIITEQFTAYEKLLSTPQISKQGVDSAMIMFSQIVARVIANPITESLDLVWDFFIKHKNDLMREGMALAGAPSLPRQLQGKVETLYTLFRQATNGIDVGDPKKVNQNVVKSHIPNPPIVIYLQGRAKRIMNAKSAPTQTGRR